MIKYILYAFLLVSLISCGTGPVKQEYIKNVQTVGVVSIIGFSARIAYQPGVLKFGNKQAYHDVSELNLNKYSEEYAKQHLSKKFEVVELDYDPYKLYTIFFKEGEKYISNNWGKMPLVIKDHIDLSKVDAVIYIFPDRADERIAIYTDSAIGTLQSKKSTVSYCKAMTQLLNVPDMKLINYNSGLGINHIEEFKYKENISDYSQREINDIQHAFEESINECLDEALIDFEF